MRKKLKGPVKVRRGQKVHFHARLRRGQTYAFVEVFSSVNGAEPSPHIPTKKLMVKTGEPILLSPTTIRLSEARPAMTVTVEPEESAAFYLFQDVDVAADKTAITRIKRDGKITRIVQALGRLLRGQ